MRELFPIRPTKKPGKRGTKRAQETAQKSSQKNTVYFLQSSDTLSIKIGETNHLKRRISELQTAAAGELRLLGTTERYSEVLLHEMFAASKIRGEWFIATPDLVRFLMSLGFQPLEGKKPTLPPDWTHPFWEAIKLHTGEWYDRDSGSEFEAAIGQCAACGCEESCDDEDIECSVNATMDLMWLIDCGKVDGALFDSEAKSLAIVFRRDAHPKDVEWVKREIACIRSGMDGFLSIVAISWTATGDFREEKVTIHGGAMVC
jgi:hypothetical protein